MLSVSFCLCDFLETQKHVLQNTITEQGNALRDLIQSEVNNEILPRLDSAGLQVDETVTGSIASIQAGVNAEFHPIQKQLVKTLATTEKDLDAVTTSLEETSAQVGRLEAAIAGPLDSAQQTFASIKTATDESLPFALGAIAAAKVTLGETAQTMKVVRDAAPRAVESAVDIEEQMDGVASDIHAAVDRYLKPKTWKQKLFGAAVVIATGAVHLL
jgi:hypothetical protein